MAGQTFQAAAASLLEGTPTLKFSNLAKLVLAKEKIWWYNGW
jgi:hypothetical protein